MMLKQRLKALKQWIAHEAPAMIGGAILCAAIYAAIFWAGAVGGQP
jgi:hypothetical protein